MREHFGTESYLIFQNAYVGTAASAVPPSGARRTLHRRLQTGLWPTQAGFGLSGAVFYRRTCPGISLERARLPAAPQPKPTSALSSRAEHERPKDGHAQSRDPMPADIQQRPTGSPLRYWPSAVRWCRAPREADNPVRQSDEMTLPAVLKTRRSPWHEGNLVLSVGLRL